ncbi:MAG: polymerase subunit sigma-24 [Agromyces sp.]|jgi:RNA polymerase sigma-70 factor (ECF subfamily)|nr:polymerase subunit sigma-24 [Agromyces sp.]
MTHGAPAHHDAVARAHRDEWARVVATLIRQTGDWTLAEECAAEAFARAVERWPAEGVPRNPGAWLTTVAKHLAVDRMRRRANEAAKIHAAAALDEVEGGRNVGRRAGVPLPADDGGTGDDPADPAADWTDAPDVDDRLRLVFTCCHPALALESRVALTLRTLGGLTTGEIARAFLVPEATMAQRIVRAKQRIRNAGIPYRVPDASALPERVGGVLAVLYLVFNAGYSASGGDAGRRGALADEAIRLARLVVRLLPEESEAASLLALMLLQDSRRRARLDADGELVTLDRQDRSRWDAAEIASGLAILRGLERRPRGIRGPYRLQAEIAACHAAAPTADATDFERIASLYDELAALDPSPVVALNRALAQGFAGRPQAGLDELDRLAASGALDRYHLLPAAQGELLARLGRADAATTRLRAAIELAPTDVERRALRRRIDELVAGA